MRRWLLPLLTLCACAGTRASDTGTFRPAPPDLQAPRVEYDAAHGGEIVGQVEDANAATLVANALVVLQSKEVGMMELTTDDYGRFVFDGLPPGTYTVQAMFGHADISRVVQLEKDATAVANFSADPGEFRGCVLVYQGPLMDESLFEVTRVEARLLGVPKTRRGL